ncbi:MAG: chiB1, partial [Chthonomonadaceae bacterium]|nr:chiB1 [Chthonomonadaceae bacterium]
TVTGTSNTAVTWSVQEGASGGSISSSGVYTPPATAGTFHVVATSVADATQQSVVPVIVQAGSASGTIQ